MAVFLRVLKNLVKTFIENDELKQFTCFGVNLYKCEFNSFANAIQSVVSRAALYTRDWISFKV